MALFGMNVARTGDMESQMYRPDDLREAGVSWVRLVAMRDVDINDYVRRCHDENIRVLLVIARESLDGDSLSFHEAADLYATRYAGRVDAWQVGNEADHVSPSSWSLSMPSLNDLMFSFRERLPGQRLVSSGLVSGDPKLVARARFDQVDMVAVHPYGAGLPDFPSPYNFGPLPDLLGRYAEFNKRIWITEWGVNRPDFPTSPTVVLDYYRAMLRFLRERQDIEVAFIFCWSDAMVPGFGLHDAVGDPNPEFDIFRQFAAG